MDECSANKSPIDRITNISFVLVMGVIFIVGYILMNTIFPNYFMTQSNGNMYVESNIFYAEKLGDILRLYGETGRACYIRLSLTYDFILPLQYSLFFVTCSILILKKYIGAKLKRAIILIGGVLCLSDWLENIFIITAINRFPNIGDLPILAQVITILKSALTVLFLIVIVIGIIMLAVSRIKRVTARDEVNDSEN
jgi:hypothetical protein